MKGKFFKCDCGADGLWVEYSRHFGTEIALFSRDPSNRSWSNRIRLAWACLRGKPYKDDVILCDQQVADLIDHLIKIQNYDQEAEYTETIEHIADRLCGVSCGTAVDSIIEYVKRPDCSKAQLNRLISDLTSI